MVTKTGSLLMGLRPGQELHKGRGEPVEDTSVEEWRVPTGLWGWSPRQSFPQEEGGSRWTGRYWGTQGGAGGKGRPGSRSLEHPCYRALYKWGGAEPDRSPGAVDRWTSVRHEGRTSDGICDEKAGAPVLRSPSQHLLSAGLQALGSLARPGTLNQEPGGQGSPTPLIELQPQTTTA